MLKIKFQYSKLQSGQSFAELYEANEPNDVIESKTEWFKFWKVLPQIFENESLNNFKQITS